MNVRQGSRVLAALLGAVLLFGAGAAAQVPGGGAGVKAPFINGDCVKASSSSTVSTVGAPCGTGSGSVTSVNASGGTTGLSFSGGPITTSGTLTLAGGLVVANGGTGAATFTTNGVIYGNATSALGVTAAGTTGQVFIGNTGSPPSWTALSSLGVTSLSFASTGLTPNTATQGAITVAGTLDVDNGGSGAATFTANGLLYGSGTSPFGVTAAGTTGQYLKGVTSGAPAWGTVSTDLVSSITFGTTGLTPSSGTTGAVTVAGTLGFANGGTSNTAYTDGQLLIGNTATGGLSKATLTQGANVTITNGNGTITIAAAGAAGGCATAGSATQVLTDNGSGGCTSNAAFLYSAGTATLGTAGSVVGSVALKNATSGTLTLSPPTGALGTVTVTVPAATDTLVNLAGSQVLTNKTVAFASNTLTGVAPLASPVFTGTAAFAALSATGQFTSTLATGTAPFVVASTTNVANLNASSLGGATFAAPGAIGGGTAAAGTFTTLTANTSIVLNGSTAKTSTSGTGLVLATSTGSLTSGRCVEIDGNGNFIQSAAACSSGSATAPSTKTTNFNAAAGGVYCVDTTSGAVTATLPGSPANGDTIKFWDCKQRFATANLILGRNSLTIMNIAENLTVATTNYNFSVSYVSDAGVTSWIIN